METRAFSCLVEIAYFTKGSQFGDINLVAEFRILATELSLFFRLREIFWVLVPDGNVKK